MGKEEEEDILEMRKVNGNSINKLFALIKLKGCCSEDIKMHWLESCVVVTGEWDAWN